MNFLSAKLDISTVQSMKKQTGSLLCVVVIFHMRCAFAASAAGGVHRVEEAFLVACGIS